MKCTPSTMYIEDLIGSEIVTAEGKHLGHVVDVQVTGGPIYEVTALIFGEVAWLYRYHVLQPFARAFGLHLKPHTVLWDSVERCEHHRVMLKPGTVWKPLPERVRGHQKATSTMGSQE